MANVITVWSYWLLMLCCLLCCGGSVPGQALPVAQDRSGNFVLLSQLVLTFISCECIDLCQ